MSQTWFTADEHYGHLNVIRFCKRPFNGLDEMHKTLIENHNRVVAKEDTVYHLGDMFWRTLHLTKAISILANLNGQHHYVWGNHDDLIIRNRPLSSMFQSFSDIKDLKIGDSRLVLCHYAMRTWPQSHRGAYHLYGHSHGELPEDGSLSMDVGVDPQNFTPISLDQVIERMNLKAAQFAGMEFVCTNKECGNRFRASNNNPHICTKCSSEMELTCPTTPLTTI